MDEEEKERIFRELQAEIRAGLEAYERGECIPLEDVISSLRGNDQLEWSSEGSYEPVAPFQEVGWYNYIAKQKQGAQIAFQSLIRFFLKVLIFRKTTIVSDLLCFLKK